MLKKLRTEPDDLKPNKTLDQLTADAAGVFAEITKGLDCRGGHAQKTAQSFVQVVFRLFVENIGLFPDKIS